MRGNGRIGCGVNSGLYMYSILYMGLVIVNVMGITVSGLVKYDNYVIVCIYQSVD